MQYLHVLLVAVLSTLRLVSAQGVGNAAAQAACAGFAPNAMKCLTDVSYVFCPSTGNAAVEQFVAAGSRCAQGIPGIKVDSIEPQPATTTRTFAQFGADSKPRASSTSSTPESCPTVHLADPKCMIFDRCKYPGKLPNVPTYACDSNYCKRKDLPKVEVDNCYYCMQQC
ncbi:hypothetical protein LTR70_000148 [Exophiala xenobiotica]|uniref:Uncharacterized protein n=1 Tax=Lithohypha guttulata TaxID=1690604 RepID=A0ABR0KQC7_9EURO|nr:hypothetical protein LTR24_000273 [Lithohypha guttulata]KAK5330826.1 hypothetical protein LTR70_000148 [Exophiala xenobiotica]